MGWSERRSEDERVGYNKKNLPSFPRDLIGLTELK